MMINNLKNYLFRGENIGVYKTIAALSLVFIILLISTTLNVKRDIYGKINQNIALIIKSIEYSVGIWIEKRVQAVESASNFIEDSAIYKDGDKVAVFNSNFLKNEPNFELIQEYIEDKFIYINDEKIIDFEKKVEYYENSNPDGIKDLEWFKKTKNQNKTTISFVKEHFLFRRSTINICTPINDFSTFKGVICGVLDAENLFKNIEGIETYKHFYYFIKDDSNIILSSIDEKDIESKISNLNGGTNSINLDSSSIYLSKISRFDWTLGVGVDKNAYLKDSIKNIVLNTTILFIFFVVFMTILNILYSLTLRKTSIKKKEMELLLARRSRLNEIGSLITSINHQLKQPLNSLKLTISNTQIFAKNSLLTPKDLDRNLELCKDQIGLMDDTIKIFRNLYIDSDKFSKFDLLKSINSLIFTTKSEFTHHNITVKLTNKEPLMIESIESLVQQILLVLMQNAKDALIAKDSANDRNIYVEFEVVDGFVLIRVKDYARGISRKKRAEIFSPTKGSDKKFGFGIGLYFSKMMSVKKLGGDLYLENSKNPTVFLLKIPYKELS